MRELFDGDVIGWFCCSFNEDYAVTTAGRTSSGPAENQTLDRAILHALMPDRYPRIDVCSSRTLAGTDNAPCRSRAA
jgi:hypothetical protein